MGCGSIAGFDQYVLLCPPPIIIIEGIGAGSPSDELASCLMLLVSPFPVQGIINTHSNSSAVSSTD